MKIIKLRRGPAAKMPALSEAELVYASDTNELYIGADTGNTTFGFNGGKLTDTTKGRFIPRHGASYDLREVEPGELFFLEDKKGLAIGLEDNCYIEINKELNAIVQSLVYTKRDKDVLISSEDIANDKILLQHLSPSIRKVLTGLDDPIEVILVSDSIATNMLKDKSVTINKLSDQVINEIERNRQVFDFGKY